MEQCEKPEFHYVRNTGELSGKEMAELSEAELTEYLNEINYSEQKRKYRIKPGFILREIAGEYAIVPVDADSLITNAVMSPNESAVFLWKAFEHSSTKEDVVRSGMQEYDVTEEAIRKSIDRFVEDSLRYRILEEVK